MAVSGSGFSTGWLIPPEQTLAFKYDYLKEAARDFYFGQPGTGPINVNLSLYSFSTLHRTPPVEISGVYPITKQNFSVTNRPVTVKPGVSVVLSLAVFNTIHRSVTIDIPGTGGSDAGKSRKKRRIL